jgi:hypothetical protein
MNIRIIILYIYILLMKGFCMYSFSILSLQTDICCTIFLYSLFLILNFSFLVLPLLGNDLTRIHAGVYAHHVCTLVVLAIQIHNLYASLHFGYGTEQSCSTRYMPPVHPHVYGENYLYIQHLVCAAAPFSPLRYIHVLIYWHVDWRGLYRYVLRLGHLRI